MYRVPWIARDISLGVEQTFRSAATMVGTWIARDVKIAPGYRVPCSGCRPLLRPPPETAGMEGTDRERRGDRRGQTRTGTGETDEAGQGTQACPGPGQEWPGFAGAGRPGRRGQAARLRAVGRHGGAGRQQVQRGELHRRCSGCNLSAGAAALPRRLVRQR